MAVRLIQRARRLLAVPISFKPPSACVPSERTALGRLAPVSPCLAALHTTSPCRLPDVLPEVSESSESQKEREFSLYLDSVAEVDELLRISTDPKIARNNCVLILEQISKRQNLNQAVLNDSRFHNLLERVHSAVQDVSNYYIIKLMKSLYMIGLDSRNRCVQSVEVELRWRLRRFSMGHLVRLSSIISLQPHSKDRSWLLSDLLKQVELRWTEITNTRELVVLISRLGHLSEILMERLEDKVLEFAEAFTPEQTRKLFAALAAQHRRMLPVLRALSFHLVQHKFELAPKVILDLALSYAKLNFRHQQVLEKLATDLIPKLPEITPSDIAMVTWSWSALRTYNHLLFEAVVQTCLERNESFTASHLCFLLLNFATINFQTRRGEFFDMIHKRFVAELDSLPFNQQLNAVWSLCVLGQVTRPYFQKILEPQFYNQVLEDKSAISLSYYLKLMQINATALLESPDYPGPLLPNDALQTLKAKILERSTTRLQNDVAHVLQSVFPDSTSCNYKVPTIYGWVLDAEVILDSESKPLAVTEFVAPHNLNSQGSRPLPEGAKRLAIVCAEFSHYVFRRKELLGIFELNRRLLRAGGFLVVEVPYYEWEDLQLDWQKQSFLKEQIKKLMAEEAAH